MYECVLRTALVLTVTAMASAAPAAAERRDPLRPPDYRAAPAPTATVPIEDDTFDAEAWTLTSTLVSSERRVAVVNDRAVRAGETIAGARVLGIERDRVRLEFAGREFTVHRATTRVRVERGDRSP